MVRSASFTIQHLDAAQTRYYAFYSFDGSWKHLLNIKMRCSHVSSLNKLCPGAVWCSDLTETYTVHKYLAEIQREADCCISPFTYLRLRYTEDSCGKYVVRICSKRESQYRFLNRL